MKNKKNKVKKSSGHFGKNLLLIVAVALFVKIFFFEVYQVPSISMVNTILPGEVLLVNKSIYGARLHIDPENGKETRIPGLSHIKHNDVIVFNFPGADTIYKNRPDQDYYGNIRKDGYDKALHDTFEYGPIIYLPINYRQPFVKRCIGLPGDTIQILKNIVFVNNKFSTCHADSWAHIKDSLKTEDPFEYLKNKYIPPKKDIKTYHYHFPHYIKELWYNRSYGPLYIPKKGDTITLSIKNLSIYNRVINTYEHNQLDTLNGFIYINGCITDTYIVKQNYYYMMGDNYWKSIDSRFWGFVPENHIIGKAVGIVWSWDKSKQGCLKIRKERLFRGFK